MTKLGLMAVTLLAGLPVMADDGHVSRESKGMLMKAGYSSLVFCESMCTLTSIERRLSCNNFNSESAKERCSRDEDDWQDRCLMECRKNN